MTTRLLNISKSNSLSSASSRSMVTSSATLAREYLCSSASDACRSMNVCTRRNDSSCALCLAFIEILLCLGPEAAAGSIVAPGRTYHLPCVPRRTRILSVTVLLRDHAVLPVDGVLHAQLSR